ncbi:MAG TPA: hypothetical protein VJQ77_09600 [Novosphingobium sp.]|nr:hypothetical protein [Novosphingobium sp.]
MAKLPTEKRSTPRGPRVGPGRSFARGLVVAVPAAILLWALFVWLVA